MDKNYYVELSKINVGEHIEKKGKFSYLSWAWAVDQLRRVDPTATWRTVRFDGMPYMKTECGYFVEVEVTCNGISLSQIHPVLDNNNKPIAQPNAFQINTSIQRCLVKAIALHGLGLYIYAGEDLPFNDEEPEPEKKKEVDKSKLIVVFSKWELLGGTKESFAAWLLSNQQKHIEDLTPADIDLIEEKLTKKLMEQKSA